MRKGWSIKSQIALLTAAIAVIILGIEAVMIAGAVSGSRDAARRELENVLRQVENDVDLYCREVESVVDNLYGSPKLQKYFTEASDPERFVISQYVQDIINATLYGNQNIATIKILQADYRMNTAGSSSQQAIFFKVNLEYGLFDLEPEQAFFTRVYRDETTGAPYFAYLRPTYPVGMRPGPEDPSQKKLFYLLCRLDSLQERVASLASSLRELEIVVADEDTVLLANDRALLNAPLRDSRFFAEGDARVGSSRALGATGWTAYLSAPRSLIDQNGFSTLKENLVMAGLSLALLLVLAAWVTRNLTNPVTKLSRDIDALYDTASSEQSLGSYELREIDDVASYINRVLDRIRRANDSLLDVQERLHQSVVAKKEAELAFYQTQINPHFLYNTLECMRSIGQAYNVDEIQVMANSMAKIFRYSIKARDTVTVAEELDCIRDYFEIIKIRFLNRFWLSVDVPEELRALPMPKMILQPLIENAVGHGLNGKRDGGVVEVRAGREGERLLLLVRDDGVGIPPPRLAELNRSLREQERRRSTGGRRGVALDNINRRIKLDFGAEYGLSIQSTPGKGTCVTVALPVLGVLGEETEDNPSQTEIRP